MYKTLSPYAINVNPLDLNAAIQAARIGGFEGLEFWAPGMADLIDSTGADAVKKTFTDANIKPAAWGLPVQWRQSEEKWRDDLANLARCARAAQVLGTDRCFTWVLPASNERDLQDQLEIPSATLHTNRADARRTQSAPRAGIHRTQYPSAMARNFLSSGRCGICCASPARSDRTSACWSIAGIGIPHTARLTTSNRSSPSRSSMCMSTTPRAAFISTGRSTMYVASPVKSQFCWKKWTGQAARLGCAAA